MGTKGEKERGQTARQPRNTRQEEEQERRTSGGKTGREERGTRMATRLGSGGEDHGSREGADREQTEKKEIYKYLREKKREKTPLRLAKACKCVYIHFTQYRGVSAVYCTFFYIL